MKGGGAGSAGAVRTVWACQLVAYCVFETRLSSCCKCMRRNNAKQKRKNDNEEGEDEEEEEDGTKEGNRSVTNRRGDLE